MDSWDVHILLELVAKISMVRYRRLISARDCWIFDSRDWNEAIGSCLCKQPRGCAVTCIDWRTGPFGCVCKCRVRGGGVCLQQCCCGNCHQCREFLKNVYHTLLYWWRRWKQGAIEIGLQYLPAIGQMDSHMDRYSVVTTMHCLTEVLSLRTYEVIAFPIESSDVSPGHFVEAEDPSGRRIIFYCQRRRGDITSSGLLLCMEGGWFRILKMPRSQSRKLERLGVG
jgi:hypothetical protein